MRKLLLRSCRWITKSVDHSRLNATRSLSTQTTTVNNPPGDDIEKWQRLLLRRQRLHGYYGDGGVREFLYRLKLSKHDLAVDSKAAEVLWIALLENAALQKEVLDYAIDLRQRTGRVFAKLYYYVMSSILLDPNHHLDHAVYIHSLFRDQYIITPRCIQLLAPFAVRNEKASATFKAIYDLFRSGHMSIYDQIVPTLLQRGNWVQALEWHEHLLKKGDGPQSTNYMQDLQDSRPDLVPLFMQYDPQSSTYVAKPEHMIDVPSPEDYSILKGISLPSATANIDPLSDRICSRLFATRTLSVNFIISGLKIFESRLLGPLAMRELFLRAKSAQHASQYLQLLKDAEIDIQETNYSDILLSFVVAEEYELLQDLVTSDLHPETFDDLALQHKLLAMYALDEDHLACKRTRAVLNILSTPGRKLSTKSTLVISKDIFEPAKAHTLTQQINDIMASVDLEYADLDTVMTNLLSYHHYERRKPSELSTAIMMLNISNVTLQNGHIAPPRQINTLLTRLGKANKFDLVWNFSTHIMSILGRPAAATEAPFLQESLHNISSPVVSLSTCLPISHAQNYLAQIFTPRMLKLIIVWGMKNGLYHFLDEQRRGINAGNHKAATSFFLGLRLIDCLRALGLRIDPLALSSALVHQIMFLCSKGLYDYHSAVRETSIWTVEELLVTAIGMWNGPPLFPGLYDLDSGTDLPSSTRSSTYKNKNLPDILGGLLPHAGIPPLPLEQRLAKRLQIRKMLFSGYRVHKLDWYTPEAFDTWLTSDAGLADQVTITRYGSNWTQLIANNLFSRANETGFYEHAEAYRWSDEERLEQSEGVKATA
jgi:hypothetical protein